MPPPRTATTTTTTFPSTSGDEAAQEKEGEEEEEDRPLTDEELAWKLMQEEEAEFQQRMLALAGVPYLGAPSAAAGEFLAHDGSGSQGDDGDGEEYEEDDEDAVLDTDTMSYEQLTALGEVVGTVATGLNSTQIDGLPVCRFSAVKKISTAAAAGEKKQQEEEGGEVVLGELNQIATSVLDKEQEKEEKEEDEQCAVCRLEFEDDDEVKVLRCGHYYHPECIGQWLERKKNCIICNKDVLAEVVVAAVVETEVGNSVAPSQQQPASSVSVLGERN